MSRTPHGCSRTAQALTRCLSHCPPPSLDDFLPWLLSHALPSQLLPLCLSLWTSRISSTTLPIPSPSNPAQCPSSILLCLQPCLPARSIPWPSRGLVPQPSPRGLLHGSRDVAAVLHQLEPVILHDPPRDGPLACPQAAVQDVVPAMHWRRNIPCRLRPAASLPASLEGEGAAAGRCLQECCRMLPRLGTQAPALLRSHPGAGSPLPPSNRKQRRWGTLNRQKATLQPDCVPPALQLARQDTVVFIYPTSGCCNTDTHSRGAGNDFSFIY